MTAATQRVMPRRAEERAAPPRAAYADLPAVALLEMRDEIVDLMADGADLFVTLDRIARSVERLAPPALCSILLLQPDGKHLSPGAAPSLPHEYCQAIEGLEIGPSVGSCGTAAWRKEPVIVSDIATDPLWEVPREFVLSFGLRACWSMPVIRHDGVVLGTIAMYYREPRAPTPRDWGLLEPASRLIRLALAQARKEEELRDSEARWHLAADASGMGTFDVGYQPPSESWSPRFKAILGVPETTKASLALFRSLLHPGDLERFNARFRPLPEPAKTATRREELRIFRADTGEERIVVMQGRALFTAHGTATRAIGTLMDVTDQRLRERELAEAKFVAERANRAKSTFLANMSHELRTPLNAIIGFSDVILQGIAGPPGSPKYREYVEDIHKSGGHLLSLINDILDMAKIEAGKRELNFVPVDLGNVAARALHFVEAAAQHGRLTLAADIARDAHIVADERAVMQILTNLLSNAVKFTAADGRVTVFARANADGGLALGVEDTGIGMSQEDLKRAMEPFGQVEHSVASEGRGTGLGLPIVKALTEAQGAAFHIESAPGEGTRAWAAFPAEAVGAR